MPRVIHFEIQAEDTNRASKFYESTFGWKFNKWDGTEEYYLINTGPDSEPGINGGLMKRRDPNGNVYNSIKVDSVDEYIKKVEENGGGK
jgi:predicted enzyme related to lactoylglutathione lyase